MAGLAAVSEAADRGDWEYALNLLEGCGPEKASAEGLELRARALYCAGDFEGSVSAWEDLHGLLVAENDLSGAAMAAATVAMFLMIDTGRVARLIPPHRSCGTSDITTPIAVDVTSTTHEPPAHQEYCRRPIPWPASTHSQPEKAERIGRNRSASNQRCPDSRDPRPDRNRPYPGAP